MLARRLAGEWNAAHDRPKVLQVDRARSRGSRDAPAGDCAGGRDRGRPLPRDASKAFAEDAKVPEEVRVAAVEALGSFRVTPNRVLDQLIASVRGKPSSNSVAEAAVRAMFEALRCARPIGRAVDRAVTTRWVCAGRRCGPWRSCRMAALASSSWPAPASFPKT